MESATLLLEEAVLRLEAVPGYGYAFRGGCDGMTRAVGEMRSV